MEQIGSTLGIKVIKVSLRFNLTVVPKVI